MKRTLLFLSTVFSIFLISGCKLDAPDLPEGYSLDGNILDTYQPVTEGSYWKYTLDFPASAFYEVTMTNKTKTINNKVYSVANSKYSDGSAADVYYNITNHACSMRQQNTPAGDIFLTYLVDNADIGYSWTEAITEGGSVNDVPGRIVGTIIEKGITKTVAGKVFKNVIHTTVQLQYALLSADYETLGTYDFYVAKGVGIIEINSEILGIKASTILSAYKIK